MPTTPKQALINLVAAVDQQRLVRNDYPSVFEHADKHVAADQQLKQAMFEANEALIADNPDEADATRWRTMAEQMVEAINGGEYCEPAFFAVLDDVTDIDDADGKVTVARFNASMDEAFAKVAK